MLIELLAKLTLVFLLLFAPGYITFASFADRGKRSCFEGLETIFGWILVSILIISLGALLLAELGRFSLVGIILIVAGYSVALILIRRPRLDPLKRWRELTWDRSQVLALGLLLVAALLFFRPFENIFGGRDGGVYVNTGIHIARTGAILAHDDFFAQLPQKVQEELLWVFPGTESMEKPFKFPGFYWVQDGSLLVPQFFHLYPVWIGLFYAAFGVTGALFVTPLFGWLGALGLYLVGRTFFRAEVGLAALALMIVNASQIWFSRYANADIFFQFLFLSGLLYWTRFVRQGDGLWGVLSGACFGEALLAKLDAEFLLIPLVLIFGYLCLLGLKRCPEPVEGRKFWYFVVPFATLAGLSGVHIRLFAWPYYAMSLGFLGPALLTRVLIVLLTFFAITLILSKMGLIRRTAEFLSAYRRPTSLAVAACIIAMGLYLYFVLPQRPGRFYEVSGITVGAYTEQNFVRLGWYLTPLGLLLAVIGLAQIVVAKWNKGTSLLILSALTFSALNLSASMIIPDHIWAIRRYVSVIMPSAALFMAYALWRIRRCPEPAEGSSQLGASGGLAISLLVGGLVVGRSLQVNWPLIFHQEFSGAIAQVQELADALPERALVIFDGSQVGNFLAAPLTFLHDRETMVFWPKEGGRPVAAKSVEAVATAGIAEGREVFFVSTHEHAPFSAKYDMHAVRAETLEVPQLEHALDHFPQEIERLELPYRVYHLRPAAGHVGYEAESLPHKVGRVVEDGNASWGQAMYAHPAEDDEGSLCYGPYVDVPEGRYRALFRLKAGNGDGDRPVAVIDVAADAGKTILARKEITGHDFAAPGQYQVFALDFENPLTQALEFRVYFTGAAELWVDHIEVLRSHVEL